MNQVIYGEESRLLPWACERIGVETLRHDAKTIGLERGGALVAVVVFDGFSDTDCYMHVASDGTARWLTREFLVRVFAYPFIQCGLRRVTALMSEKNSAAIRFNLRLGFIQEGTHREACANGDDLISTGLLRRECRWLPAEYQK